MFFVFKVVSKLHPTISLKVAQKKRKNDNGKSLKVCLKLI